MSKKIIHERLYPRVKKGLSSRKSEYLHAIQTYIDENHEALFANNPGPRLSFTINVETKLFDICGLTPEEIVQAVDDSGENKSSWYNRRRPAYPFLVECIRYFDEVKDEKSRELTIIFLTILIYSFQQRQFIRYNTGTGFENCMQYTVNNLSNKFLLKQYGTIYKCLEITGLQSDKTYYKMVKDANDFNTLQYFTNILTRVRQFIKKLMNQFMENRNSGKYINYERETTSNDGEDSGIMDVENVTAIIVKIVNNAMILAKTSKPSIKIIRLAAMANEVSQNGLFIAVEKIFKQEDERLEKLFRSIITIFLVDQKHNAEDINSSKFFLVCQQAYSKSHTNEKNVIELKRNLEDLLEDYCIEYNKTNRSATKINFKKALFYYMIMHIQISKRGAS